VRLDRVMADSWVSGEVVGKPSCGPKDAERTMNTKSSMMRSMSKGIDGGRVWRRHWKSTSKQALKPTAHENDMQRAKGGSARVGVRTNPPGTHLELKLQVLPQDVHVQKLERFYVSRGGVELSMLTFLDTGPASEQEPTSGDMEKGTHSSCTTDGMAHTTVRGKIAGTPKTRWGRTTSGTARTPTVRCTPRHRGQTVRSESTSFLSFGRTQPLHARW
jgi:hypothetical protein